MLEMSMAPEMEMRVTPALLNLASMLPLSSMALHHLVQQELSSNPALEEIEVEGLDEAEEQAMLRDLETLRALAEREDDDQRDMQPVMRSDEDLDPLMFVAAPRSLTESLLVDLQTTLPQKDHAIAAFIVGNLDERGFLADDPESLAATLDISLERINSILQHLRDIGPPGIGARDTRECLLAQIEDMATQEDVCPYAVEIVDGYLSDLAAHRYKYISQALHISMEEVEAVRDFVRLHLWPYPAYSTFSGNADPYRPRYSLPDVSISEQSGKFMVEVLHSPRRLLRLNPLYSDLARKAATLNDEERTHVQDYITRARTFLSNLRQRESTLQQISEAVVNHQESFLRHGVRQMAALTRSEIAAETGLHESTVSRATSDKTVLLPHGQTMPFCDFFVASLGVQDVLRELIEQESSPLSDAELARLLKERGYRVARRTVAKYREQMNILPSTLR